MDHDRFVGYLMLLAAMVLLGASFVAAEVMVAAVPKFLALGLRFGMASIVLLPVMLLQLPRLDRGTLGLIGLQALAGPVLFNVLLFHSLERTSAGSFGIIYSTLPIATAALSWLLLRERLTMRHGMAIVLAVAGAALLSLGGPSSGTAIHATIIGNLMAVAAVLSSGLFAVLGKRIAGGMPPVCSAGLVSFAALLMVLPAAAGEAAAFDFAAVDRTTAIAALFWAAGSGVGFFVLWYAGLVRVEASTAGTFTAAVPVTALALSSTFTGVAISWGQLSGMACACAGIAIYVLKPRFAVRRRLWLWS
jgi:drug/metabolite transporter (DMT)-like permease